MSSKLRGTQTEEKVENNQAMQVAGVEYFFQRYVKDQEPKEVFDQYEMQGMFFAGWKAGIEFSEKKESWERLKKTIEENRTSYRKVFKEK